MTCTDTDPCLMCQIDNANQDRPTTLERGPTIFEAALGGMAVGFCLFAGFAIMWALGLLIDRLLDSVYGFGQVAFGAFTVGGLLAGIWRATMSRR